MLPGMGYLLLPKGVWSGRFLGWPRALQGHTRLPYLSLEWPRPLQGHPRLPYPTLRQPMALQGHPRRDKCYLEWGICYLQWGKCYSKWGMCYLQWGKCYLEWGIRLPYRILGWPLDFEGPTRLPYLILE